MALVDYQFEAPVMVTWLNFLAKQNAFAIDTQFQFWLAQLSSLHWSNELAAFEWLGANVNLGLFGWLIYWCFGSPCISLKYSRQQQQMSLSDWFLRCSSHWVIHHLPWHYLTTSIQSVSVLCIAVGSLLSYCCPYWNLQFKFRIVCKR